MNNTLSLMFAYQKIHPESSVGDIMIRVLNKFYNYGDMPTYDIALSEVTDEFIEASLREWLKADTGSV